MLRLCHCDRPGCLPCEIRTGPPTARNQRIWRAWGIRLAEVDLPPVPVVPQPTRQSVARNGTAPKQPRYMNCIHLGPVVSTTGGGCGASWLRHCTRHGLVTWNKMRREARMVCSGCTDCRTVRNLLPAANGM